MALASTGLLCTATNNNLGSSLSGFLARRPLAQAGEQAGLARQGFPRIEWAEQLQRSPRSNQGRNRTDGSCA